MSQREWVTGGMIACLLWTGLSNAQPVANTGKKTYADSRGVQVVFPQGDNSFATQMVRYSPGAPPPSDQYHIKPSAALGPPNYLNPAAGNYTRVSLGCGGEIVLRFKNPVIDIEGPDLYVFEVGPDLEPTFLSISPDGQTWLPVGEVRGGTASADISTAIQNSPVREFYYVLLRDLKTGCGGGYSGADIDAVGAIGTRIVDPTVCQPVKRFKARDTSQPGEGESACQTSKTFAPRNVALPPLRNP